MDIFSSISDWGDMEVEICSFDDYYDPSWDDKTEQMVIDEAMECIKAYEAKPPEQKEQTLVQMFDSILFHQVSESFEDPTFGEVSMYTNDMITKIEDQFLDKFRIVLNNVDKTKLIHEKIRDLTSDLSSITHQEEIGYRKSLFSDIRMAKKKHISLNNFDIIDGLIDQARKNKKERLKSKKLFNQAKNEFLIRKQKLLEQRKYDKQKRDLEFSEALEKRLKEKQEFLSKFEDADRFRSKFKQNKFLIQAMSLMQQQLDLRDDHLYDFKNFDLFTKLVSELVEANSTNRSNNYLTNKHSELLLYYANVKSLQVKNEARILFVLDDDYKCECLTDLFGFVGHYFDDGFNIKVISKQKFRKYHQQINKYDLNYQIFFIDVEDTKDYIVDYHRNRHDLGLKKDDFVRVIRTQEISLDIKFIKLFEKFKMFFYDIQNYV